MSLGITNNDFASVLSDLGVTISYKALSRVVDGVYGSATDTYAAGANKTWVFLKRNSKLDLTKWGIFDVGDAYVFMTTSDSLSVGDRLTVNSETYEYSQSNDSVGRFVGGTAVYNYYTLTLVV